MKLSRRRVFTGLAVASTFGIAGATAYASRQRYYAGPVSDHFDGVTFFDPHGVPPKSFVDLARWWSERRLRGWPAWVENTGTDQPPAQVEGSRLRVSFVGHASILVQTAGGNILLDPVWSERISPVRFAGPKRINAPGIAFDALPKIDAVLVSHNHWDHLDIPTLERLVARHDPLVVVPLGNDTILRAAIPTIRCEARDWGDRIALTPQMAVTLAPMRHWSARGLTDRNKALWAAFIIETPAGRIYHIGDTGYGQGHHFKAAREQHGPFRLAILPIGAYEPRWFMRDQHMNPQESVQAFADCGAEFALAHHHSTFQLTDEAVDAPIAALAEARNAAGIDAGRFRALAPGESWDVEGLRVVG